MRSLPCIASVSFALLSCLAPTASAQQYVDERIPWIPGPGTASGSALLHGDIDGDGFDEIVVRESGSLDAVLRGGPGAFAMTALVDGHDSNDSALGDLNNDGYLDLLTQKFVSLGYYVGQPGATLGAFVSIQAKGTNEVFWTKRVRDLNNDGAQDVVSSLSTNTTGTAGVLRRFFGTGLGAFGPPQSVASAPYPVRFELGDFDADGFVDAAAAAPQGTAAFWFRGNATGFTAPQNVAATGADARLLAVGDFDGDTIDDLVCAPSAATFTWFRGSVGGFVFGGTHALPGALPGARDLKAVDIEGDGDADLLLVESIASNGRIWRSLGAPGTGLGTPAIVLDLPCAAVDLFDYDGKPGLDLVYTGIGSRWPTLRPSDGTNGYLAPIDLQAPGVCVDPDSACAGDVDRDGALDLAFESGSWLRGVGDGTFLPPATLGARPSQLVDLDGDGQLDAVGLLQACGGLTGLVVSLNGPTGFGAATKPPQTATGLKAFTIADLDADGDLDLASAGSTGAFTHLNTGTGTFAAFATLPLGNTLTQVGAGDLNADGLPDLAVARVVVDQFGSVNSASLAWGLSTGTGQVTAVQTKSVYNHLVTPLVLEDVTGDGVADVLFGQGSMLAAPGDGAGNLGALVLISSAPDATGGGLALALADIDGDGARDVIGGATPGGFVSIVRKTPTGYALWRDIPAGAGAGKLLPYDFDADGQIDLAWGYGDTVRMALNLKDDPAGAAPFGTGTFGCRGRASIGTVQPASVGNSAFRMLVRHMPPDAQGWFLISSGSSLAGFDPFGVGVTLHVDPLPPSILILIPSLTNSSGEANLAVPIPPTAGLVGASFTVQAAHAGAFAPGENCSTSPTSIVSSRGLALTIQP